MLEKCVLTILGLNWNQRLGHKKTKLNICHHMLTSSTQLQNRSFHVEERTRTSSKCQKIKNARAKRASTLFPRTAIFATFENLSISRRYKTVNRRVIGHFFLLTLWFCLRLSWNSSDHKRPNHSRKKKETLWSFRLPIVQAKFSMRLTILFVDSQWLLTLLVITRLQL